MPSSKDTLAGFRATAFVTIHIIVIIWPGALEGLIPEALGGEAVVESSVDIVVGQEAEGKMGSLRRQNRSI